MLDTALDNAGITVSDEVLTNEESKKTSFLTYWQKMKNPCRLTTWQILTLMIPSGFYLKEAVASRSLNNIEEEVVLAKRIEAGREARAELAKSNLSAIRRQELQHLIKDGAAPVTI